MPELLEARITSWEEAVDSTGRPSAFPQSIATEEQELEDPNWRTCADALLRFRAERGDQSDLESPPSAEVCEAAIGWIDQLRLRWPKAPPTLIIPEPSGGIIIERRTNEEGADDILQLIFTNDHRAEMTAYRNGKVVRMLPIPFYATPAY